MKKCSLLLFLIYGFINTGIAQDVIDIEIDRIHCQDGKCYLMNISETDVYNCEIISLELGTDEYSYAIDCSHSGYRNSEEIQINNLQLDKITTLDAFLTWAEQKRFYRTYTQRNQAKFDLVQPMNKRYVAITSGNLENQDEHWKPISADVYQLIPVRVSNEYYIGALIETGDYDIDYLLLPTKDGDGILVNNQDEYLPTQRSVEVDPYYHRNIFESFRVRKKDGHKVLTNSLSSSPIIYQKFDDIQLSFPHIIGRKNDQFFVFNALFEKVELQNIDAVYSNFGILQILVDNKVIWVNKTFTISDTMPFLRPGFLCGNSPSTRKKIVPKQEEFVEEVYESFGYTINHVDRQDISKLQLSMDLEEVRYLDNSKERTFYTDCFMNYFCQETNLYYFKNQKGEEGLFKRINEKEEVISKFSQNKSQWSKKEWDKLKNMRDSITTTFRDEVIFIGRFEEFNLHGYNHPIVFKQHGLYGIFPQMKESKYKSICEFVGNLAEVTFQNGETGWIDLEGKEFRRR